MNRTTFWNEKTGTEQIVLSAPGADLAHDSCTINGWVDPDHLLLTRIEDHKASTVGSLYLVNIHTGEDKFLNGGGNLVIWKDFVYHRDAHDLYRTEISTGKTEHLWQGDLRYRLGGSSTITSDGRYISFYWHLEDNSTRICRYDVREGKMEEFCRVVFPKPFEIADHVQVNPRNPDLMLFAHEGQCEYITDRIWLADFPSHTAHNLFKQTLNEEGANGDPCGHERWTPNGKGVYFVKYISTKIPPAGLWYYDLEKAEARPVASGHGYWHVAVAPDSTRLVADTQRFGDLTSEIVFVDPERNLEKMVATARLEVRHPCHPHPQFSPDGKHISYGSLDDDGRMIVGIVKAE